MLEVWRVSSTSSVPSEEPRQVRSVLSTAGCWSSAGVEDEEKFPEFAAQLQREVPQRWRDLNNSFNRQRLRGLRWQLSLVTCSNYHLLPADKRQFSANWVLSQQRLTFQRQFGGGTGAFLRPERVMGQFLVSFYLCDPYKVPSTWGGWRTTTGVSITRHSLQFGMFKWFLGGYPSVTLRRWGGGGLPWRIFCRRLRKWKQEEKLEVKRRVVGLSVRFVFQSLSFQKNILCKKFHFLSAALTQKSFTKPLMAHSGPESTAFHQS